MEIKPKPRPFNALNSSTQEHTDQFYIRDQSRNFSTPEGITYNLSLFRTKREPDRLIVPVATSRNMNMHEIGTQEKGAKISR